MGREIERKYLVHNLAFKEKAIAVRDIKQGYLSRQPTVRIRIQDDEAYITIKGMSDKLGLSRNEWEYPIPQAEAIEMLALCQGLLIEKKRYLVPHQERLWEVDVFEGIHAGLIIAEIELSDEAETFELPPWIDEEVTGDRRYYNATLSKG